MPRTWDLAIFVATTDDDDDRQTKLIALPLAHAHRVMKSCEKQYSHLTYNIILNEYTHVWASQNTFNTWTVWACLQIWRGTFIVKALWLRAWFTTEWVTDECKSYIMSLPSLAGYNHWSCLLLVIQAMPQFGMTVAQRHYICKPTICKTYYNHCTL